MKIPIYQVDAFSNRPFAGNPAAVCPLDAWLPDEQMQSIAAENNLAETAFFVANNSHFDLRWFTPKVEVDLCGHATLASAFVIMTKLSPEARAVRFETKSGELVVARDGDLFSMDFPSRPPAECEVHPGLLPALGGQPEAVLGARDYLVIYRTEAELRALAPDMDRLSGIDRFATIATAPARFAAEAKNGDRVDFVSRFFAPSKGVPEDPVTGSAHCTLIPYWARRLGKTELRAHQASWRGGDLWCKDRGPRVEIAGHATLFLEGSIQL